MIHGADLSVMRERAKDLVMRAFVKKAESDGTPPTLRAMYVMKAAEAAKVLAGGTSELIETEAGLRGLTPIEMAGVIATMADQSAQLELARMRVNVAIEGTESEDEIIAIFDAVGLKFTMEDELTLRP